MLTRVGGVITMPDRIRLAQLPTPLQPLDRLSEAWGGPRIWVKRDDLTGFGVSGNKIRKLEFHVAAAQAAGADTLITCGALQSNHCRATALVAAATGRLAVLFLRTHDGNAPTRVEGNHLLERLSGARCVFVAPGDYARRDELMAEAAEELQRVEGRRTWVIPEGASDALGMWSFVLAMQELTDQLVMLGGECDGVWHASSSGGTTAGLGWGADRLQSGVPILASSVGDSVSNLRHRVEGIWSGALSQTGGQMPEPTIEYLDRYVGLGYGKVTANELRVQQEATSLSGLIFDPTYTGKALYGLRREIADGRFGASSNVVFWHTGGGFSVFQEDWAFNL